VLSEKVFKFALVPTTPGEIDLGVLEQYYFSPEEKKYKPLKVQFGLLKVELTQEETFVTSSGEMSSSMKSDVNVIGSDLVDIHREFTVLKEKKFLNSHVFYLSIIALLSSLLYLWSLCYLLFRSKSPKMIAQKRRAKAYKIYKEHKKSLEITHDNYYEKLADNFSIFREYIGDKFNAQGSSLTTKDIDSYLLKVGFPDETRREVRDLSNIFDRMAFGNNKIEWKNAQKIGSSIDQLVQEIEKKC